MIINILKMIFLYSVGNLVLLFEGLLLRYCNNSASMVRELVRVVVIHALDWVLVERGCVVSLLLASRHVLVC